MTRIVGLDLSLVSTGVALPNGDTTTLQARHADPRERRLNQLGTDLWRLLNPLTPQLAIVEGYSLHSPGPLGMVRRAEWVGVALLQLRRMRCPIVEVPPSTLKAWATGNGNATKPAMVQAALDAGADPANDDEADAYLLRAIGRLTVDDIDPFADPKGRIRRLALADQLAWPDLKELAPC